MGCKGSKSENVNKKLPQLTGFNLNSLGSCDLVLFSAEDRWSQSIIRAATHSKWTHIGMVVHLPELYPEQGILLLESSSHYEDGLVDVLTGVVRTSGVRLVDLQARIQATAGREIACRKWQSSLNADNRITSLHVFDAIKQSSGKPYERSALQLSMSALPVNQTPDESSLFCSELVAACLQKLRVLSGNKSANSYTPKSFTKSSFGLISCVYDKLEYVQKI
jgi:hypothetical protein